MAKLGNRKGDSQLILALASGCSVREAARLAGLGERTAHRRVKEPAFRHRVAAVRDEQFQRATAALAEAATEAVATLRALLDSGSVSAQLGAARAILEHGHRLREQVELVTRISVLEESQSGPSNRQANRVA